MTSEASSVRPREGGEPLRVEKCTQADICLPSYYYDFCFKETFYVCVRVGGLLIQRVCRHLQTTHVVQSLSVT